MSENSLIPIEVQPHSIEAERTVIGAILMDPEAMMKIADVLKPEDFYDPTFKDIFKSITELFHAHEAIDFITVSEKISENTKLQELGGSAFLAQLAQGVPTASHVFQYAQIVKTKATHRRIIKAGQTIAGLGYDEDQKISELLDEVEKIVFNISNEFLVQHFTHIRDILNMRYEKFSELHESPEEVNRGISTGFKGLDHMLSGFQPSDLIILAARPAMGKTSLALNIAQNMAIKEGKHVGIFSLEMSKEQLVDRMFSTQLGVDSWKLQKGKLDDSDFARMGPVMDDLNKANIFIDDSVSSSLSDARTKARRLQMEHGLDILIIDYLQLMTTGNNSFAGNRVQEISEISRTLKVIGRELNIPVVALSQLSRAVENRPGNIPQLSDLRDSGSIEQDADLVMMMYREDYYEPDTDRQGITDIYIHKHRNGPTGKVELMFRREQMKFFDIDMNHPSS